MAKATVSEQKGIKRLNVRISDEEKRVLEDIATRYRTDVSKVIRAYIEYLMKGGAPIGYPGVTDPLPLPKKEGTKDDDG